MSKKVNTPSLARVLESAATSGVYNLVFEGNKVGSRIVFYDAVNDQRLAYDFLDKNMEDNKTWFTFLDRLKQEEYAIEDLVLIPNKGGGEITQDELDGKVKVHELRRDDGSYEKLNAALTHLGPVFALLVQRQKVDNGAKAEVEMRDKEILALLTPENLEKYKNAVALETFVQLESTVDKSKLTPISEWATILRARRQGNTDPVLAPFA